MQREEEEEKGICQRLASHKACSRQYIKVATATSIVPICSAATSHSITIALHPVSANLYRGAIWRRGALGDESRANNADFFHCEGKQAGA